MSKIWEKEQMEDYMFFQCHNGAVANRFTHKDLLFDILFRAQTLEFDINLFDINL